MNNPQNFNGFSLVVTHKMRDIGEISLKKGLKKGRGLSFVLASWHLEKLLLH